MIEDAQHYHLSYTGRDCIKNKASTIETNSDGNLQIIMRTGAMVRRGYATACTGRFLIFENSMIVLIVMKV